MHEFEEARENSKRMVEALTKRFKWFKKVIPKDKKDKEDESLARSYKATIVNLKGETVTVTIIPIYYFKKKENSTRLRGNSQGLTVKTFKKLFEHAWVFLGFGGTPEYPKSFALTSLYLMPDEAFSRMKEKPHHQGSLGDRYNISLRHIQFDNEKQPRILGGDIWEEEFKKMRQ